MNKPYFSGHNHSDASNVRLLDSTIKVNNLIDRALELNLAGVAITDHEILSNHLKAQFYIEKLRKNAKTDEDKKKLSDFRICLGNEIYLVRNGMNKNNYVKGEDRYWHFILLAKDKIGHEQLRRLSSAAWSRSYRQYIERVPTYYSDIEEIVGNDKGHLIASTACLGSYFAHLIMESFTDVDAIDEMGRFITWCKYMFGNDFYIEIQPSRDKDQVAYNKAAVKYAKKHNLKITVTTDSHYLKAADRKIHKAFLNANEGEREVDAFYQSAYMMSWQELLEFFPYFSDEQMEEIRLNTLEILSKCEEYSLEHKQIVPKTFVYEYPNVVKPDEKYVWINKYFNSEYEEDRRFINNVMYNFYKLADGKEEDRIDSRYARLEIELEEIWEVSERVGERLSAYFTTMAKIIDIAWTESESIVGPGRGSSYVMLVAYLLGITQGDPLDSPVELPHWRFLHREKIELPDIDTDFQSTKKDRIIADITKYFESLGGNVVRIATFGTETSKAALQTACRGLGLEPEIGTYLSSLVPVDRGQVRGLKDCYYGNEDKDWSPIETFIKEMDTYSDVWEIAQQIEGLISRRGIHAAGILITNDDFINRNALMKAPNGVLTSQFELHDSEYMGGLKYDLLVTDALDRIAVALNLLRIYDYIEWKGSLRETYKHYLFPKNLDYETKEMWQQAAEGKILNLFQFDTAVGSQTIRSIKPTSLLELGQANSLMRLMPEGRSETPAQEFIKYKSDMQLLYAEIASLKGPQNQKDALLKHLVPLKGVADSQESLMLLVMDPVLSNFTVKEANFLRKTIAKKNTRDVDKLKDLLYQKGRDNGVTEGVLDYIWNVQAARQMGYSFSLPHLIAYSTIAIQEMNIAYHYPTVFWNTACLIVDSAGIDEDEMFMEEDGEEEITLEIEDDEDEVGDILSGVIDQPKKKVKNVNYGKISSAIGKMLSAGIKVSLPDINRSDFTFTPDVEDNEIIFGMKGIAKINTDLAKDIIKHRPYKSLDDFLAKVKINKIPVINLIKAGAFDRICGWPREEIMKYYIDSVSDKKNKLTLANIPMLDKYGLLTGEWEFHRKLFNFNKYLKKHKYLDYYELDEIAFKFYEVNFNVDILIFKDEKQLILQKAWDKKYAAGMEKLKLHLKNSNDLLDNLNQQLYQEVYDKYAQGSISKWEMDSVNFYYHEHEMAHINFDRYDIRDFSEQSENGVIEKIIDIKGKKIPMFELWRIAGTVIDKNKLKHTVTLSTPFGVVDVKIYKSQFSKYDKQVAEKQADGTKKIVEKSWFSRGNKLMITGIRRDSNFIPKVYKSSIYQYPIQLIEKINDDGTLDFKPMRGD